MIRNFLKRLIRVAETETETSYSPSTMAGVTVSRAWQTVKPHVPLIKFRKGGLASKEPHAAEAASNPVGAASAASPPKAATQRPAYEDYQLPKKYRRAPLTEEEMAYINRGGPE